MFTNPFREGMPADRQTGPCAIVIFGATGDLTRRKLVPALYNLSRDRLLPPQCAILGFARRDWSRENFQEKMRAGVEEHSRSGEAGSGIWQDFALRLDYCRGDFDDPAAYVRLRKALEDLAERHGTGGNTLFYLATPPGSYSSIIRGLGRAGLARPDGGASPWTRVIIEKPFGRDLDSARGLNSELLDVFSEKQVYRIDHYLGKETVQNILVMRFANVIFEPLWNHKHIDHVQITVAESLGMEGRGEYYDGAGALRDMVQNHIMQLLCLTAMEPPVAFEADAVRNEKVKVLQSIRPIPPDRVADHIVRAQYARGFTAAGEVAGYLSEEGVSPGSTTETYVAMKIHVDNWRWAGVPFYLRTGKRLPKRTTEIAIQFKEVPYQLFGGRADGDITPNVLALRIQPDEGISLKITSKVPGGRARLRPVVMDFRYGTSFGVAPPDAYERLLLDATVGDSTLFTRRDEVETAWSFITGVLESWSGDPAPPLHSYEAGSWGPAAADTMLDRWRML